ncbi:MAG: redox-sensing transcriptional repressor Rex [Erysipelothrix sp.]|nr:redox-sensing transcriptional repressor Rex [Erysipelothrix sp.]
MTNKFEVPKATMKRYPVYLKALKKMKNTGVERVLSRELADVCDIQATTIRRDFSFIGSLGKQGYGYDIDTLIETFNHLLGMNYEEKIILVGIGNLGKALLNYNRWDLGVGEIVCGFDVDRSKVGKENGVPIHHISDLAKYMPKDCRVAILTISEDIQETVDLLIENGIKGVIDFSHEHVQMPKGAILKQVDVISAIQELIFQANNL